MAILVHRFPAIRAITGLSRSTLWRKEKSGDFPARIQLGEQSVGWSAAEVDRWLKSRQRGTLAQASAIKAAKLKEAKLKKSGAPAES